MKYLKGETKRPIEVEGVKLTEKALMELRILQSEENFQLRSYIDKVSELVFFLIENKEQFDDGNHEEVDEHIRNIGHLRNILKGFLFQ